MNAPDCPIRTNRPEAGLSRIVLRETKRIPLPRKSLRERKIFVEPEDKETAIAVAAYRHLRTNMFQALERLGARTLMVTGPTASVGKTTTAINLAISISRLPERTALLLDLDLRRPEIHALFGYEPKYGVVDVIQGRVPVEDVLVTPSIERLSVLTGTRPYDNSSELLYTREMRTLVEGLKRRYPERVVIIDSPPILGGDDVQAMSSFVDACLVVVDQTTRKRELEEALVRIRDMNIVGYVFNKSAEAKYEKYYY